MRKLTVLALLTGLSILLIGCEARESARENSQSISATSVTAVSSTKISTTAASAVLQSNPDKNETDDIEKVLSEADELLSGLDDVQQSDVSVPNP